MPGRYEDGTTAASDDEFSDSSYDSDADMSSLGEYSVSDAQKEWEESVRQLQSIWQFVIIPIVGKFLGRRFSYYCKLLPANHCSFSNQYGGS